MTTIPPDALPPAAVEAAHQAAQKVAADLCHDLGREYGLLTGTVSRAVELALRLLADDVLELGTEAVRQQERECISALAAEKGALYIEGGQARAFADLIEGEKP